MILYDDIITLRAIEEEDASVLQCMINDPEIESSVVGFSYPVSMAEQKEWISGLKDDKNIRYAIDNGSGMVGVAIISSIDFKNRVANLNIKLMKTARGMGYAKRAINLMLKYCFYELNLNCITANVLANNSSSNNLWQNLGFNIDGVLRQRVYKNGQYTDLLAYSLLRDEYDK